MEDQVQRRLQISERRELSVQAEQNRRALGSSEKTATTSHPSAAGRYPTVFSPLWPIFERFITFRYRNFNQGPGNSSENPGIASLLELPAE